MKKIIQYIALSILISLSNFVVAQETKVLILAPQHQDVIYVNQNLSVINILLAVDEKIDSTHCQIISVNRLRQKSIEEKIVNKDPYTVEIPVNKGGYSYIEITTYFAGKIQKTEKFQLFFREINPQMTYSFR